VGGQRRALGGDWVWEGGRPAAGRVQMGSGAASATWQLMAVWVVLLNGWNPHDYWRCGLFELDAKRQLCYGLLGLCLL